MSRAEEIIEQLQLIPHPEGGHFREVYRSSGTIDTDSGERNVLTSIFFLLHKGEKSHLHRIASDELWYHHRGGAINVYELDEHGSLSTTVLGEANNLQHCVKAGKWFGSELIQGDYCLVSCAVAPGFDFADFELAKLAEMQKLWPQHSDFLTHMCLS